MLLQRSFLACLFVVYFCFLWREVMGPSRVAVTVEHAVAAAAPSIRARAPAPPPEPAVNVVDVAADAATPLLVAQLLRLAADERIASIDDRPVDSFAAWAWLAARFEEAGPIERGDYIDLTIQGLSRSRRVLVLFH